MKAYRCICVPADEILQEEMTALELEEEEEELAEAEADEPLSLDTERVTKEGAASFLLEPPASVMSEMRMLTPSCTCASLWTAGD